METNSFASLRGTLIRSAGTLLVSTRSSSQKSDSSASSNTMQRDVFDSDSAAKYDILLRLIDSDSQLRPGLTGQITIVGEKKANALYIPRQALFLKDGKQTVYLKKGTGFEQLAVGVIAENESRAAIQGIREGDAVALIDPTAPKKTNSSSATAALGGGKL